MLAVQVECKGREASDVPASAGLAIDPMFAILDLNRKRRATDQQRREDKERKRQEGI